MRKLVQAQYLKVGDRLANIANAVVTHAPTSGISTPSGKVDLGVNGFRKTWNKRTEIAILTEETI